MEGYLKKWVNFLSGWKNRYFVLHNGILSYSEEKGQLIKGTISLKIASITEDPSEPLRIYINSGTDEIQIKTETLAQKYQWLGALKKAQESLLQEEEKKNYPERDLKEYEGRLTVDTQYLLKESNMDNLKDELAKLWVKQAEFDEVLSLLGPKFENDLEITRLLEELQELGNEVKYKTTECAMNLEVEKKKMVGKMTKVEEKTSQFGSPVRSPLPGNKNDANFDIIAGGNPGAFQKNYQVAYSNSNQPNDYFNGNYAYDEQSDQTVFKSFVDELNESKFFNGNSNSVQELGPIIKKEESNIVPLDKILSSKPEDLTPDSAIKKLITENPAYTQAPIVKEAIRDKLPHFLDPNRKIGVWEIVKNMIGKDLTKLAVPVFLNEPVSMLQRACEQLEYYELLEKANNSSDSMMRLAYVTAFAFSPMYLTIGRTKKPFNPLLGETYEWISEDGDVKFVAEQVSHHPPISAGHCESKDFVWIGDSDISSKFGATALEVKNLGYCHVILKKNNDHFTYNKANIAVKNIIFGTMYIEYHGQVEVFNHKTGEGATWVFKEKSWSGKGENEIEGILKDKQGNEKYKLEGRWDQELRLVDSSTGQKTVLWKPRPQPSHFEENYRMSLFIRQLNHLSTRMLPYLPRTDSRFRPDQRALEYGNEELAASEKHRLEEKQRAVRKQNERTGESHKLKWFREKTDSLTNNRMFEYIGGYWEARSQRRFHQENLLDIYT